MSKFKENFNTITNIIILLILIFGGIGYSVGFHFPYEILPGQFANGNYSFNGSVGIGTNSPQTTLDVNGTITQETYVIRKVITKTIADNVATSVFRIETTNETGNNDGGGYSVKVHALINHGANSGTGAGAVKSFTAQFARMIRFDGAEGVNSPISEDIETASAGNNLVARGLGTVTMTAFETSEYKNDIQFLVDATGTFSLSPIVTVMVEVVYFGFTTPPTITAI